MDKVRCHHLDLQHHTEHKHTARSTRRLHNTTRVHRTLNDHTRAAFLGIRSSRGQQKISLIRCAHDCIGLLSRVGEALGQ